MKILVTFPQGVVHDTFFTDRSKKSLEELGEVIYNPYDRQYNKEELQEALAGVDIVMTGWGNIQLDEEVLQKADQLKIVAHTGGTVADLVSDALYQKGVTVISGNPTFAESVAESCVCYTMCALRRLEESMKIVRDGGWKKADYYNEGIMDRTIGLVGFGAIAKKFAKMLTPFRVKIKVYSSYLTKEEAATYGATVASLDEIFETCNVISIHSGLNPKTYHMVKEEHFKKMKDGALIVNTARGAVLDEEALIRELQSGRILAALDVFEQEPLPLDSPLLTLKNAMLIPHMGGPTIDRREYVVFQLIEDIQSVLKGETDGVEGIITADYAKNMTQSVKK